MVLIQLLIFPRWNSRHEGLGGHLPVITSLWEYLPVTKPLIRSLHRSNDHVYVWFYYSDVIIGTMGSRITNVSIVYSTVCSGANQRKNQSSASLAFVRGIHRWPVNSPHKEPVTRRMLPFDDVIMQWSISNDLPQKRFLIVWQFIIRSWLSACVSYGSTFDTSLPKCIDITRYSSLSCVIRVTIPDGQTLLYGLRRFILGQYQPQNLVMIL